MQWLVKNKAVNAPVKFEEIVIVMIMIIIIIVVVVEISKHCFL